MPYTPPGKVKISESSVENQTLFDGRELIIYRLHFWTKTSTINNFYFIWCKKWKVWNIFFPVSVLFCQYKVFELFYPVACSCSIKTKNAGNFFKNLFMFLFMLYRVVSFYITALAIKVKWYIQKDINVTLIT